MQKNMVRWRLKYKILPILCKSISFISIILIGIASLFDKTLSQFWQKKSPPNQNRDCK